MRLVQLIFLSTLDQRGDKNYLDLAGLEPSLPLSKQASKHYPLHHLLWAMIP